MGVPFFFLSLIGLGSVVGSYFGPPFIQTDPQWMVCCFGR